MPHEYWHPREGEQQELRVRAEDQRQKAEQAQQAVESGPEGGRPQLPTVAPACVDLGDNSQGLPEQECAQTGNQQHEQIRGE